MDVLVFLEHQSGALEPAVHQVVRAARELAKGAPVSGLAIAGPGDCVAEQAASIGLDRVYEVRHKGLSEYSPEAFGKVAAGVVGRLRPGAFLLPHSFQGMEIGPYVAARLGLPLVSNCSEVQAAGDEVLASRKVYSSAWQARVAVSAAQTVVATLARHGKPVPVQAPPAPIEALAMEPTVPAVATRPMGLVMPEAGEGDITRADVVVGVGRGIRDPSNLGLIEELALALRGVVACSRPLVDLDWMPHSKQVGASGKEIAPKVYIACGISGAAQHLAGIRGAQTIIAINKDPQAPIFGLSDYGVVGDLFEIVPALIARARERRQVRA